MTLRTGFVLHYCTIYNSWFVFVCLPIHTGLQISRARAISYSFLNSQHIAQRLAHSRCWRNGHHLECLTPRALYTETMHGSDKEPAFNCCLLPALCSQLQVVLFLSLMRGALDWKVLAQYLLMRGTLSQMFQIRAMGLASWNPQFNIEPRWFWYLETVGETATRSAFMQ